MAGANLSTLSNILKEYYLGPIQEQFNTDVLISQLLQTDGESLEGLKAVIPLHTGRSGGIGARAELVTLPTAGNQGYQRATYNLKYHYARIQVSGPSISLTQSDSGAFARALKDELSRIKNDVALDFSRQVYGDGTGQIAQCAVSTTTNVINLATDEALQKGFIYVGMIIDIGDAGMATPLVTSRTVTDVDVVAKTITISGATTTTAATHFVYRAGNVDAVNAVSEMDSGLAKLVSTATNTVGGLNAGSAGLKFWDNLRDTTGGAISLSALMVNWNKVANAGGRADEMVVITTPGLLRRLFETPQFNNTGANTGNIRFLNSETLKGGFSAISFNAGGGDVKLYSDRLAPFGKVQFIHKAHMRLFSPGDWDFLSRDGLTIRWVTDTDAFQAVLYRYANMGTDRRNTSLVMSGLTDTGF